MYFNISNPGEKAAQTAAFFLLLSFAALRLSADEIVIDPVKDGFILGGGVAAALGSELLLRTQATPDLGSIDKGRVNAFDRLAFFSHSAALDTTSSVLMGVAIVSPAVFGFLLPFDQAVSLAVVYAEAFSYSFFAKNMLKYSFPRYRPYVYSDGKESPTLLSSEDHDSFPSGHATTAFTAAAFSTYAYSVYFPDSPFLLAFGALNYGLATLTAVFRVTSGMHFTSDVLVGALVGTAFGILVPYVHTKNSNGKSPVNLVFLGNGAGVDIRL